MLRECKRISTVRRKEFYDACLMCLFAGAAWYGASRAGLRLFGEEYKLHGIIAINAIAIVKAMLLYHCMCRKQDAAISKCLG
jgi:hypothetical protein